MTESQETTKAKQPSTSNDEYQLQITPTNNKTLHFKKSGTWVYIHPNPTGNCQIQGISGAEAIMNMSDDAQMIKAFNECFKQCGSKMLLLIDVQSKHQPKIEKLFKDRIHCSMPFQSTWNRSQTRIIYLLKRP